MLLMDTASIFAALAFLAFLPALWMAWKRPDADHFVLGAVVLAIAAPSAFLAWYLQNGWVSALSTTLWATVTAGLAAMVFVAVVSPTSRRLLALALTYFLLVAAFAEVGHLAERANAEVLPWSTWIGVHVAVSVATYSLLSLGAVAGLGVLIQQRALRRKKPSLLSRRLPSLSDGSKLQFRLLLAAEVILGISLVAGVLVRATQGDRIWEIDHKTLLSISCFLILGVLLILQFRDGLRGGVVARTILVGYVLLTLAFPGVKIVTDIILAETSGPQAPVIFVSRLCAAKNCPIDSHLRFSD